MALNIKNERVHALAREAAAQTGKTQTGAIEQALEELLERHRRDSDEERRRDEEIRRLLDDIHARVKAGPPLMDIDELYDEDGLPA